MHLLDIIPVKHIAFIRRGGSARRRYFIGNSLRCRFIKVKQRDLVSLSRQKFRKAGAEHTAGACNYNNLAHIFFSFSIASNSPVI